MVVRRWVFYVMLGTLIVLCGAVAIEGAVLLDSRHDQRGTTANLSIGCGRANRTRDALHWLALHNVPVMPAALAEGLTLTAEEHPQPDRPWLVDCDAAYP